MARRWFLAAAFLPLAGCARVQSALDPQSAQAAGLHGLIWLFVAVCGAVWLAVMAALAWALIRRRSAADGHGRGPAVAVAAAVGLTVAIIAGLTLASFLATRALVAADEPLVIHVRGYQWWWEVTYPAAEGVATFKLANEIHVPVGRPVRVDLTAADVIHSFWVPQLGGKQDMIPGRENPIAFTAEKPGVYRGQCAEFCGMQHAHMALMVVAEAPEDFAAWRRGEAAAARPPADEEARAGAEIFQRKACSACHTVRGTPAAGVVGPDLTHVGARRTIAAGVLETTRGSLAAWIADPQTVKPGNNMPAVPLEPAELRAVSAYMAALK